MIGKTLGGKYTIVRQLGEGGMGAVYEARHEGTGRRVAVKVITGELASDPKLVARFELEARAAGAIESEHIAQVIDVGRDGPGGVPFLAMEYLVGEDVQHLFDRLGPLPPDLALRIGVQACLGLEKAHAQSVVHRDIKPANLFLTERDAGELRVKVLDFGIAKVTGDELSPEQKKKPLTRTGTLIGSPLFMSPEQARGRGQLDHRTDVWSLGIVLYQALSGRTPFHDVDAMGDFIIAVCSVPVPAIRSFAPWVDPAIAQAVERALFIDPGQRYPTIAEMRLALEAFLPQGTSIRASMLVSAGSAPRASVASSPTIAGTPLPYAGSIGVASTTPAIPTSHPAWAATVAAPPPGTPSPVTPAPGTPSYGTPPPGTPSYGTPPPGTPSPVTPPPGMPAYGTPPPVAPLTPAPRGGSGALIGAIVAAGILLVAAGSIAGAYAFGVFRGKAPAPIATTTSAPPAASEDAGVPSVLMTLHGAWLSDTGQIFDAVPSGHALEFRVRDADPFPGQDYVAGDTYFALRPMPNEADAFRVEARIRPVPPKGTTYDRVRARTTCVESFSSVHGQQLRADVQGERLVVQLVRIEPTPAMFQREGARVVGCTGLSGAHAVELESILTPLPDGKTPVPRHDGGAPVDAGSPVDAGTPRDAGAPVDAGGPPDAGTHALPFNAPCQESMQCVSRNCVQGRCRRRIVVGPQ